MPPVDALTKDGFDLQWGTNVVGHFYFTELLMPALTAGAQSSPDHHARVVTTSSSGAYLGKLEYGTMKDGAARTKEEDLYLKLVRASRGRRGRGIIIRQRANAVYFS